MYACLSPVHIFLGKFKIHGSVEPTEFINIMPQVKQIILKSTGYMVLEARDWSFNGQDSQIV